MRKTFIAALVAGLTCFNVHAGETCNTSLGAESTSTAPPAGAVACGNNSHANGNYSTAVGHSAETAQYGGVALGSLSTASGSYSTALGAYTNASGTTATAVGAAAQATATFASALGRHAKALSDGSVALGANSIATRSEAVSVGFEGNASRPQYLRQITNVADPSQGTDAVNLRAMQEYVHKILVDYGVIPQPYTK